MILIVFGIILLVFSFILSLDDDNSHFTTWYICFWGSALLLIGILLKTPTAMDLHAGKAVIKYEIIDGVKVDSTFVFKNR